MEQKILSEIKHSEKHSVRTTQNSTRSSVAIIGLGYVGLPLAILSEERGYSVLGIDIDEEKRELLKRRIAPSLTAEEQTAFQKSSLRIHADGKALAEADIVLICVPTPVYEDHTPDFAPLMSATELVGLNLREGQLIVVESTINPGVCEELVIPLLEKRSGLKAGTNFFFAHCPERINPGDNRWSVRTIARVIGADDEESLSRATDFYRSILDAEIHPMKSLKEAEAVKVVENSFRDINIAFVNELAMSFDKLGIDVVNVINGASTKPFSFMAHYPGCGVGGHCIPVDPYYLITYAAQNGFTHRFLSLARDINNKMPRYAVDLLSSTLRQKLHRSLKGTDITLLGLSYKKDISDLRESPALEIQRDLLRRGAAVRTFDPLLPHISTAKDLDSALSGATAVILATDHTVFRELTPATLLRHGVTVIIDGRNCLPKEVFEQAGIIYKGIGR